MPKRLGDIARPARIISAKARLSRIIRAFHADTDCRAFILARDGKPVGLIHRAAAMELAAASTPEALETLRAGDLTTKELQFADANMTVERLIGLNADQDRDFDPDIVVVQDGRVAGFICVEQLTFSLAEQAAKREGRIRHLQKQLTEAEKAPPAPATPAAAQRPAQAEHTLLATLAHEIRTPLTGMMGLAEMLATKKLDAEAQDLAETIVRSGQNLDRIVTDTLDFARLGAGRLAVSDEPSDMNIFAEDLRALWMAQSKRRDLSLTIHVSHDVPTYIKTDTARLQQIVNNLISNALKFTRQGGISVRIATHALGEQLMLSIEVADTGRGIPDADKERLFSAFETEEGNPTVKGWGLGLTICNAMANHLGGSLTVSDNPGGGSVFTLLAPVKRVRPELVATARPKSGKFVLGSALLIEDHEASAFIIEDALSTAGWVVQRVANLADAETALQRTLFQVVLTDLHLPDGHAGTLSERIRGGLGLNAATPLIAVTADIASSDEQIRRFYGFDRVVRKPVQGPALVASIADVLMAGSAGKLDKPDLRGRLAS